MGLLDNYKSISLNNSFIWYWNKLRNIYWELVEMLLTSGLAEEEEALSWAVLVLDHEMVQVMYFLFIGQVIYNRIIFKPRGFTS
jgi:hypothetical protein